MWPYWLEDERKCIRQDCAKIIIASSRLSKKNTQHSKNLQREKHVPQTDEDLRQVQFGGLHSYWIPSYHWQNEPRS